MTLEEFQLVEDCLEQQESLNDWEIRFVNDLYAYEDFDLSPEQKHKLNQIAQKLGI